MAYFAEWLIPYRVMSSTITGDVTPADVDAHTAACLTFMAEAHEHAPTALVHNLFDSSQANTYPPFYMSIHKSYPVLRMKNRGGMYHVVRSDHNRRIMDLTAYILRFPIQTFQNRDEAIEAIKRTISREDNLMTR